MRTDIKIVAVSLLIIVATGCTATKKKRSGETKVPPSERNFNNVINNARAYNITDDGLVLKKGRITLTGTDIEGEFGVTARLNNKGDLIASVKGPMGIEVLRILSVGNDVCGISKLNRTVYIGKKDDLMKKHGLPGDFLRIIFGDVPDVYYEASDSVTKDAMILKDENEAFVREISICMEEMKVCSEDIYSFASKQKVSLSFNNFIAETGRKYASEIEIIGKGGSFHVKLDIEEMIPGYTGEIVFNVPSYKRENL